MSECHKKDWMDMKYGWIEPNTSRNFFLNYSSIRNLLKNDFLREFMKEAVGSLFNQK